MREHRLCYGSPAPDIESGVAVCVGFMSASCTPKHGLTGTVLFVDMSTHETLTASIARVNNEDRNACHLRFIFDKAAQFGESPVVQTFPLLFIGLNPGADILEVFKTNCAMGAFSFGNDATRYVVVDPLLETALSSAHFPKPTFGGSCAFLLQYGAAFSVPLTLCFYVLAAELLARGIGSDINDTQVNPKNTFRRQQIRVVKITNSGDIPMAANKHQIHFAFAMLEQLALMFATNKPDLDTSVQRPNRNLVIRQKTKNPVVVGLCAKWAKNALRFLVQLVGIRDLSDATNGNLRSQLKTTPNFLINNLMQIKLPECFSIPRLFRNPATRLITPLQRLLKQYGLFWRGLQFNVSYKFHNSNIETLLAFVNTKRMTALRTVRYPSPA